MEINNANKIKEYFYLAKKTMKKNLFKIYANIMKEDIDFNNMNELFGLLTNEISYSYLAWKYFKIFGENSKNFEDILQIVISSFFGRKINCDFKFSYGDGDYYVKVYEFIREVNIQNYNDELKDNLKNTKSN